MSLYNVLFSILQHCSLISLFQVSPLYNCTSVVDLAEKPHSDLIDVPLENPDLIFYTDDFPFRKDGQRYIEAHVISDHNVVWAVSLPSYLSAQAPEKICSNCLIVSATDKEVILYIYFYIVIFFFCWMWGNLG